MITKYDELKQTIFDCVKFCSMKELEKSHKLPKKKNARKKWRENILKYISPTISEFKAESKKLFGEEYSIIGIYAAAIKSAKKEYTDKIQ